MRDRTSKTKLAPGEMSVVELNGVTEEFGPGKPFHLAYVDRSSVGAGSVNTTLAEDTAQVILLHVDTCVRGENLEDSLFAYDAAILCVANLDYKMDPEGYTFRDPAGFTVRAILRSWLEPSVALRLDADGFRPIGLKVKDGKTTLAFDALHDAAMVLIGTQERNAQATALWNELLGYDQGVSP